MAKKKQARAEWEAERRVRIKQIITDGIMSAGLSDTRKRAFLAALETVSARIEKEETQALLVRLERKIARIEKGQTKQRRQPSRVKLTTRRASG
jgi:hypothetical protein